MPEPEFASIPEHPFPVGVEHYRGPIPKLDVWDGDYARMRAAGLRIVRSHSYWNHMEPRPGQYELDDFDLMFDLGEKHGLYVWLDIMLGTHGACPEWLTREHPDMRVVNYLGQTVAPHAGPAYPQGGVIHCYDHPAWREYGGALLRHVVNRYKDRPSLLIWGLWDGVNYSAAWSPQGGGFPCYCDYTRAKYKAWLRERYTLDELNERFLRRYRRWEDVEPPRSHNNVVEMLVYRRFHYENLAAHLQWMVDTTNAIDPMHEKRAHGAWFPRPWDEVCAPYADSWGMSMPSNNLLTSDDPYKIAERAFSFDWSRSVGKNGRWWNEEIYAGMSPAGVTWKKQSDAQETTTLLWMTLAHGAAGAMFWQYRPEYLSFESPGYSLTALDGADTPRLTAAAEAVSQIQGLHEHLPLECPPADVAVVYHPDSQELFTYNDEGDRFMADMRGVYRTLWSNGIPADVLSPNMDWSGYKLVVMPNAALMTEALQRRIEETLENSPETRIVAEGSFGMYSADGQSSYAPPQGFAERFGVRVADFSGVTPFDIREGRNQLATAYGDLPVTSPCGYAVLEPLGTTKAVATLDGATVAVQTEDARFTWFGLTMSAGFGDVGVPEVVLGLARDAGVAAPIEVTGDPVVPVVRRSRLGGRLLFVFNVERTPARCRLRPRQAATSAQDLLAQTDLPVADGAINLEIEPWGRAVIHLPDPA